MISKQVDKDDFTSKSVFQEQFNIMRNPAKSLDIVGFIE